MSFSGKAGYQRVPDTVSHEPTKSITSALEVDTPGGSVYNNGRATSPGRASSAAPHSSEDGYNKPGYYIAGAVLLGLTLVWVTQSRHAVGSLYGSSPDGGDDTEGALDELGRYVLKNFDSIKPVANFLAGVGGAWGTPIWAFYVNRGQAVSAFGIRNKDGGIKGRCICI